MHDSPALTAELHRPANLAALNGEAAREGSRTMLAAARMEVSLDQGVVPLHVSREQPGSNAAASSLASSLASPTGSLDSEGGRSSSRRREKASRSGAFGAFTLWMKHSWKTLTGSAGSGSEATHSGGGGGGRSCHMSCFDPGAGGGKEGHEAYEQLSLKGASAPAGTAGASQLPADPGTASDPGLPTNSRASSGGGVRQRGTSSDPASTGANSEMLTTDLTKLPDSWNVVKFEELEMGRAIGEGSFGQVRLAKYCQTTVAVKLLAPQKMPSASSSALAQATLRQLSKEVGIMSRLRHPNCTQYLGVCAEPPALLMEYCSRRSVDTILKAAHSDPKVARQLTWARLLGIAADAAKGMLYLHSRHPPIIHRDLKSANLLVDAHWHCKVADFNLSKAVEANSATTTIFITNPRWLAPEVLLGGHAQLESDVWAMGTVLWELMTWQLPFESSNPFQIILTVTSGKAGSGLAVPPPDQLPAGPLPAYAEYVQLMQACWARDPVARPTMEVVASTLLSMLGTELRRASSLALARSGSLTEAAASPCTPHHRELSGGAGGAGAGALLPAGSGALGSAAWSAGPGPAAAEAGGSGGGAGGVAGAPSMPRTSSATEALLAAGHVTVANAGLSQVDSSLRGYPFVNPKSFFIRMRSELQE